ncbi:hypothetical protein QTN25_010463 [Entamoeba marina]
MNNEEELKQQYDEKVLLFIDLQKKFKDLKNIKSELENNLEQTQNQLDKKNKELFTRTNEVEEIIKIEEYLKGIEKQFRNTLNNFEVQHNEYKDVLNTTINEKKKLMDGLEVIANYCKDQKQLITDQKRFLKTKDNEIVSLKQMNGYLLQQMNELVELAEEKLNSFNLYCKRGSEEEKVTYVENDNKFIFECGYTPPQCIDLTYNTYYCIIPVDYNKDVYYWNYQNREELFGYSDYYNFPVHFPIPVLKGEAYSIFYYINPDGINYQFIRLNVIAEKKV